jgi:LPS-assembly lipoprotein
MTDRRRLLSFGLSGASALALAGCFRPLYGSAELTGLNTAEALADIDVKVEGERLAHYLKNEIEYQLTGGNVTPGAKRFVLEVKASERLEAVAIDRAGTADAATLLVEANYTLKEAGKPDTVTSGIARSSASYERSSQRFATVRAARDAQIRNAKLIAEQIKTRLAIALQERARRG